VFLPQLVEDVGGVETCVVAQLAWDDLQRLCHGGDDQLFLASHRSIDETVHLITRWECRIENEF
jgi:hypothetical protein